MLRNYRKPMVIAAPKIGLKHPLAVSSWQEFDEKQCFDIRNVHSLLQDMFF